MNKLILMFFAMIHILAFTGRASAFSTEFIAKFEITHNHHHEHSDDHQHEHDEIELDAKNVYPNLPAEEHTHRHEIVVSSQIPYIQSDTYVYFFNVGALVLYPKFDQVQPQAPFLNGIFRPPIQV
ncbi:MAG: hypothetical protein WA160_16750 [Pseudobdellovibrio sp.]